MPFSADSLMSSTTGAPSGVTAKGTRSRSRPDRRLQSVSGSKSRTSPRSSRESRSAERFGSVVPTGALTEASPEVVKRDDRRLTTAWAVATSIMSATARAGSSPARTTSIGVARVRDETGCSRSRRVESEVNAPHFSGRSMTVTPFTPPLRAIGDPIGTYPPSTTTMMYGMGVSVAS